MPLNRRECEELYNHVSSLPEKDFWEQGRRLAKTDLYYLLTRVLGRADARNQWCFDRCREVQAQPNGYLDLWSRDHYKSSILSISLTIQDILNDPEVTFGVFSFSATAAQGIVAQIKRELESRGLLRWLFPDIIWTRPSSEAPSWSVQGGITVKRQTNPRECTVEGHSFMEGAPVGKHFAVCLYDDVVTMDSVQTPDMIIKTTQRWELSIPLGRRDAKRRYVGTRYHFQDTYREILERGAALPRIHAAEDKDGNPVFMTREQLDQKRREMGPMTYACQMMLDPRMDSTAGFLEEWLRYYDRAPARDRLNVYIVVDSSGGRAKRADKKASDWTVMWAIGVAGDYNYYVLDCIRDRINLKGRARKLIDLWCKWSPNPRARVNAVGYERYGKDADVEAIEMIQGDEARRFPIIELGGQTSKIDRINKLEPLFAAGRIWFPRQLFYMQSDGVMIDLIHHFRQQEYLPFPAIKFDDMLDAMARILDEDLGVVFPKPSQEDTVIHEPKGTHWAG